MPETRTDLLLDVRTPSEYAQGHIPGAVNFPLFTDEERAEVGTTYVRKSRLEAIERGLDFVGPRLGEMARRIGQLAGPPEEAAPITLYCARGGMRSSSVAWLLGLLGYRTHTLPGGFKTYKHRLEEYLSQGLRLIVLQGPTGAGKTDLLHLLEHKGCQVLDLEGLARHRGSAFGYLPGVTQPTGEMLRCLLIDALERLNLSQPIFTESESLKIGRVSLPETFFQILGASDYILVDTPREVRARRIAELYGSLDPAFLLESFAKIEKRIGSQNRQLAEQALGKGDLLTAIGIALDYYDKAYARSSEIIYRGRCLGAVTHPDGDPEAMAGQIRTIAGV